MKKKKLRKKLKKAQQEIETKTARICALEAALEEEQKQKELWIEYCKRVRRRKEQYQNWDDGPCPPPPKPAKYEIHWV